MEETTFNSEQAIIGFLGFQQFHQIKSKLKPLEALVVENTGNGFRVSVGKIKHKNTRVIGRMTPVGSPSYFDNAESITKIHTSSFPTPPMVFGFKSSWEDMLHSPKNHEDICMDDFMAKLAEILKKYLSTEGSDEMSYHIIKDSFYHTTVTEITIKNLYKTGVHMMVGFSQRGNALYSSYGTNPTKPTE